MHISLSSPGGFLANRSQIVVVTAIFAVSLLLAQHADLSHIHEAHEQEIECEICLSFSMGDVFIIEDTDTISLHRLADIQFSESIASVAAVTFKANARGPPLTNNTLPVWGTSD